MCPRSYRGRPGHCRSRGISWVSPRSAVAAPREIPTIRGSPRRSSSVSRIADQLSRSWLTTTDLASDLLSSGTLTRLGTTRFSPGASIHGLAYTPGGRSLVTASEDRTLQFWNPAAGRETRRIEASDDCIWFSVPPGPLGRRPAPGDWRRIRARISLGRDLGPTASRVLRPGEHNGSIVAATSERDCQMFLLDPATGRERECLDGPRARFKAVTFSSDGGRFVSASKDGTALVSDLPRIIGRRSDPAAPETRSFPTSHPTEHQP